MLLYIKSFNMEHIMSYILEFIYDIVVYKLYNKFGYKIYNDYWLFIGIIGGKSLLFSFSADMIELLDAIDLIFGLNPNL